MRRLALLACCVLASLGLSAADAQAAAPTLGPVSATDIQGVSVLLLGAVNPNGLASSYRFQYVDQAGFAASGFASASASALSAAGEENEEHPARAAIAGLKPDTTYHYRLVASNGSGTTTGSGAVFTTTEGFGFLAGSEGFAAAAIADGNTPATVAGTHPYQLNLSLAFNQGGEFEGQPGVPFPDGDL